MLFLNLLFNKKFYLLGQNYNDFTSIDKVKKYSY